MGNKEFIVLDLEGTCYEKESDKPKGYVHEIIEIGAFKVDKNGDVLDMFSKFLKPYKFPKISEFCTTLTTIKQEDIDTAEDAVIVLGDFIEWCGGNTLVSWGGYDLRQLNKDLELNNIPLTIPSDNHINLKSFHQKHNKMVKQMGMKRALAFEGIELKGTHHRGIDDALNIAKIFKKYITHFL